MNLYVKFMCLDFVERVLFNNTAVKYYPKSPKGSLPSGFPKEKLYEFLICSHACYILRRYHPP